ncbi:MAG: protein kinase [Thermoanaerobaculia bacterium]
MTPERFRAAKAVFLEALEIPGADRLAFVQASCAEDADLVREVEGLLARESAGGLDALVRAEAARLGRDCGAPTAAPALPSRIGPYEIVRELGRGGMGTVYLAIQRGPGFERRVALKVIRVGLDSAFVVARFRAEQRILSALEHPNIARLYDGGTTEDGLPWFAMEYVEGEHLIEWADRRGLTREARLRLFLDVCAAVQFAHQNLVVHRDLKPGNVLVSKDGVPKLLDFGLAKLLDVPSEERTATMHRILTPEYASPEQVRGDPITTASDVYSLGVVLFRLLTGRLPYRLQGRSVAEISRAVLEQRPISEKTSLGADLDTILETALAKEPLRRYATAERLAEDLRRALEHRPVLARGDTLSYRAGRFFRRHWLGLAAAALVFVSLAGGSGVALWQARRARVNERAAQRRFQEVRALAKTVLFDLHDQIETLPGSTKARATLVSTSLRYLDSLAKEAGPDPALVREIAAGYARLADIQGGRNASLGDEEGALRSRRAAIALLENLARPGGAAAEDLDSLAAQMDAVGHLLGSSHPEAPAAHARALGIRTALFERDPSSRAFQRGLARSLEASANYHADRREFDDALTLRRRAHDLFAGLAAGPAAVPTDRRNLALSDKMLGALLHQTENLAGARTLYEEAIALDEARLAENPGSSEARMDLSFSVGSLGSLAVDSGDFSLGRTLYTRALALRQEVASSDPANAWARRGVARAHERLADIEQRLGHPKAAEAHRLKSRPPAA